MDVENDVQNPNPYDPLVSNNKADMVSSTISVSSSLTSPVDSGVQLLDSENDLLSVMTNSGLGSDLDTMDSDSSGGTDRMEPEVAATDGFDNAECEKLNEMFQDLITSAHEALQANDEYGRRVTSEISNILEDEVKPREDIFRDRVAVMTKSDIANQNVTVVEKTFSTSAPSSHFYMPPHLVEIDVHNDAQNYPQTNEVSELPTSDIHQMEGMFTKDNLLDFKTQKVEDIMNVSLNSYELLDYTAQNKLLPELEDQMHVSMSEEVNEHLVSALKLENVSELQMEPITEVLPEIVPDEQIVFRRQRKKKSKGDTPKKRVSFHEDILNSTKIDDIHINHGFITMEPDVSSSFFQRGFTRKPDVVEGRYSWAAEGDAPFYNKPVNREIKSDIYVHNGRYSSSSSSGSVTSSIDEEDPNETDECVVKTEIPSLDQQPKSSCLKKSKKKYIGTQIVEEDTGRKRSDSTTLLDVNLFGSLKNILNFSTSVPLAERGVPEGQEDVAVYSVSQDSCKPKSRPTSVILENLDITPIVSTTKASNLNLELKKTNLKLTPMEGFHPLFPPNNLPANVLLCDSNVYEHKGISYSYEYDNFKKTFDAEPKKPKSSKLYQKILREFNFFKRKAKEEPSPGLMEDEYEFVHSAVTPTNDDDVSIVETTQNDEEDLSISSSIRSRSINQVASTSKMDWSDNETISDLTLDSSNKRHLNSPKRRINKVNHYALQNYKFEYVEPSQSEFPSKSLPNIRSKTSLINRFLRNVTVKKMLDIKLMHRAQAHNRYLNLYVRNVKPLPDCNTQVNNEIEEEIYKNKLTSEQKLDKVTLSHLKNQLFRDQSEVLLNHFLLHSAYTTSGEHKPLLFVLSCNTLYIASIRPNGSYCNHFVLPYTELNTVLIGPNAQTIHLANYDGDMQCIVTTGCAQITNKLMARLEMAMRRDVKRPALPAVKQLTMRDMGTLRRSICKQTAVHKDEEYFYYSIVDLQEYNTELMEITPPLGPNKEGPLMFKISEYDARWETAYFILKAGVLYMLSAPSNRVPMRVLPLINGACEGARRVFSARPHTFQLIVNGSALQLAAPDEYVASDWLQALIHAASGNYNVKERNPASSCSLLMTSDHILAVREAFPCNILSNSLPKSEHTPIKGASTLSCAAISDITAFRLPSAEHSWCVLEFACREVHESSGDWILYFSSNEELENFISTLEMLWAYHSENSESFPLSTIPDTDVLNKRCLDVYRQLKNAWPSQLQVCN